MSPLDEARRSAGEFTSFFRSLSRADRWAAGASLTLLLTLALPWQWTKADDEVIGLVAAWPGGILAALVAAMVYLRSRRAGAAQEQQLKLAQVVSAGLALAFSGYFLRAASNSHSLRAAGKTVTLVLSSPQPGAYAGLLCAAAALVASVVALLDRG